MERFVLLQVVFNLVFLANILYLHRRQRMGAPAAAAAVPGAAAEPAAPRAKRRPLVLTLGLHAAQPRRPPAAPAEVARASGLEDLVLAAERAEADTRVVRERTQGEERQRAAEDLRANLRRLKERLERQQGLSLR